MMAVLLVVVVGTLPVASGWTALAAARFLLLVAAFYAAGAARRAPASLAAAIAAACGSVFAACEHLGAAGPTRVVVFSVVGAALAVASARLGERLSWARATARWAGHAVYFLALAGGLALVAPELALGNPSLSRHAAAFGTLTACAWVARRALGPEAAAYSVAWRALALLTYGLVGVRLGYHPWRDSAYYTLPVGAVMIGLGAWASRREDRADAAPLLWLGSLLAAGPMLLHALDNRFVSGVSPEGYDLATLGVGLALALVGVLLQLRAPSAVGAAALAVDLFVVAFGKIEWNQLTLAVFATFAGALMIAVSWFILYRRDDLYRMRDFLGARVEAFRSWK
jgi:hypothetical protein